MHENFIVEKFMQFWASEQHSMFPGHAESSVEVQKVKSYYIPGYASLVLDQLRVIESIPNIVLW